MSRIAIPPRDSAKDQTKPILDSVAKQFGFAPNLHRLMALSPPTLTGWAGLQTALAKTLDAKTRVAIALAVSQADECDYCLAVHSYSAQNFAKISPAEIDLNRRGQSKDVQRGAAAKLARSLIETRGHVDNDVIGAARDAGFSDAQIVEITALAAQYLLTNLMNNMAGTVIDFPRVAPAQSPSETPAC
jgi:uncharacterized peroxidase-related enzyme